jgi:hypothetical protein
MAVHQQRLELSQMINSLFYYRRYWVLYDSNALWNNYIPKNFKIILINNGGGGILEFYQVMKKRLFLILILKPHIV